MEIVTIKYEDSIRYVGKLVTESMVNRAHNRNLPSEMYRMTQGFDTFSSIGYKMYLEGVPLQNYREYIKSYPIRSFTGPVEAAFIRYGYQSYGSFHHPDEREVYVFSRLVWWARRWLYVPSSNAPDCEHVLAWMFPDCFEDRTRGFMITQEAYVALGQLNQKLDDTLRAINGKLIIVE